MSRLHCQTFDISESRNAYTPSHPLLDSAIIDVSSRKPAVTSTPLHRGISYVLLVNCSFDGDQVDSYPLKLACVINIHQATLSNMPMIHIPSSQAEGGNSTSKGPSDKFVGDVYLDKIHFDKANTIANVTFTPCARTNWHTHEHGQLIRVVAGSGWVCDRGDKPKRLRVGDTVSSVRTLILVLILILTD